MRRIAKAFEAIGNWYNGSTEEQRMIANIIRISAPQNREAELTLTCGPLEIRHQRAALDKTELRYNGSLVLDFGETPSAIDYVPGFPQGWSRVHDYSSEWRKELRAAHDELMEAPQPARPLPPPPTIQPSSRRGCLVRIK